jgi:hypothetical protein
MLTVVLALALTSDPQPPSDQPAPPPVSLDRIRRGLERPPGLRVSAPMPEPTYRVRVVQHPYFLEVPFTWTFAGGGVPAAAPSGAGVSSTPPLIQVDALPMLTGAVHAIRERAARHEVQQAIAEFCAEHSCVLR